MKLGFLCLWAVFYGSVSLHFSLAEVDEKKAPSLPPSIKFDETFRLRMKHDVTESIDIIKKLTDVRKAKSLVHKAISTVTKEIERLREEQLLKAPANPEGLTSGSISDSDVDAYVNLASNLLVFSNVVLYQPDLSRDYLRKDSKKRDKSSAIELVKWAASYCRDMAMFKNHTKAEEIVSLMEQELELVPRDPNYTNPYAHRHKVEIAREEFESKQRELEKKKGRMKKPLKQGGPRLSDEL